MFDDFRTSVLGQHVKLINPLVDLSRLLRVQLVHFLSETSVGHLGAILQTLHAATFVRVLQGVNRGRVEPKWLSTGLGEVSISGGSYRLG